MLYTEQKKSNLKVKIYKKNHDTEYHYLIPSECDYFKGSYMIFRKCKSLRERWETGQ